MNNEMLEVRKHISALRMADDVNLSFNTVLGTLVQAMSTKQLHTWSQK